MGGQSPSLFVVLDRKWTSFVFRWDPYSGQTPSYFCRLSPPPLECMIRNMILHDYSGCTTSWIPLFFYPIISFLIFLMEHFMTSKKRAPSECLGALNFINFQIFWRLSPSRCIHFFELYELGSITLKITSLVWQKMLYKEDIAFLTSNFYHLVFDTIAWTVFCISIFLYVVLMVIVIRKSPKEMKKYKWYIVFNYTLVFMIEIILGLTHPRFLMIHPGIITGKKIWSRRAWGCTWCEVKISTFFC